MVELDYPLERIIDIKKRRVEEAEKILKKKREELEKEKEILREKEAARDEVLEHQKAKLAQLRYEMDHGTTTDKIQQMKAYLKVVAVKLEKEEKKVEEQQEQVTIAEKAVEEARKELKKKRLEVDKLNIHKKDWIIEMKKELAIEEGREQDEIGNVIYLLRKIKGE